MLDNATAGGRSILWRWEDGEVRLSLLAQSLFWIAVGAQPLVLLGCVFTRNHLLAVGAISALVMVLALLVSSCPSPPEGDEVSPAWVVQGRRLIKTYGNLMVSVVLGLTLTAVGWQTLSHYRTTADQKALIVSAERLAFGEGGGLWFPDRGGVAVCITDPGFDDARLRELNALLEAHPFAGGVRSITLQGPAVYPGITDESVSVLISWQQLEFANLYGAAITPQGAERLADLPEIERLIFSTPFPAAMESRIERRHPRLAVNGANSGTIGRKANYVERGFHNIAEFIKHFF